MGAVAVLGPGKHDVQGAHQHSRPRRGGVAAFTLEEVSGKWQLTPAWLSRDMDMGEETVIANGIVFAYSSGVDGTQVVKDLACKSAGRPQVRGLLSSGAARRIPNSRKAMLYALDGQTGNDAGSCQTIHASNHFSGITVANGRVINCTFDGNV